MNLTEADLKRINEERRHRGQPPLTLAQAQAALAQSPQADGDAGLEFLIGLAGIPFPSAAGIAGYMMSDKGDGQGQKAAAASTAVPTTDIPVAQETENAAQVSGSGGSDSGSSSSDNE